MNERFSMKNCLTIAGSDCSGGAGIQADIKAFSAMGTYGMSVITSVVAENTSRVISIQNIDCDIIADQIDAVFEDIEVSAVKLGMLPSFEIIRLVSEKLVQYKPEFVVCDPVMVATSGDPLCEDTAEALRRYIFPIADLVTPNMPEAQALSGVKVNTLDDFEGAAEIIMDMGVKNLLIKGGHFMGDAVDVLYTPDGNYSMCNQRIDTKNTHGTGCTLSSAITACLAEGMDMVSAVEAAKNYITMAIANADKLNVGKGHGPTNHFYDYYNLKGIL